MKLLQSLTVSHLLPEASRKERSVMWMCAVSDDIFHSQRLAPMSLMKGREALNFSAVLTALWRRFQSAAAWLPHHREMPLVRILVTVLW